MTRDSTRKSNRAVWVAAAASAAFHLVLLVWFLPPNFSFEPPDEAREKKAFEVETMVEPDQPEEKNEPKDPEVVTRERPEQEEPDEPEERVERETPPEEEKERPDKVEIDRKVVIQETNDEAPEEAEYLSQRANKTDEETRARETTTKNVDPGKPREDVEKQSVAKGNPDDKPGAMAKKTEVSRPKPRQERRREPPPEDDQSARPPREKSEKRVAEAETGVQEVETGVQEVEQTPEQSPLVKEPPPEELFKPQMNDYNKMFAETDERHRERVERERNNRGRSILGDWEERREAVRATLDNNIPEVKPGNHTSVNAKQASYAEYIGRIHRKIHIRWGANYLPKLDTQYSNAHPLSNPDLHTKLEFVINSPNGEIESINIVEASGELMFDAEAIAIAYTVGPHPNPPAEIVSPDGNVYVHWNFWRDQRQCGTFGASIYIVDSRRDRGG